MNPMLRNLDKVTAVTLRRVKGRLEVMLAAARIEQRQASSVREMVAAVSVVHELEEAVAAFREALATKKRQSGWRRNPRTQTGPSLPRKFGRTAPRDPESARGGRTPAVGPATAGVGAGVAGVQPPPSMGQGRPALPGAGRAARAAALADGQRAVSVNSPPHPANPSFCSKNEGISDPSNNEGDIHYAQYVLALGLASERLQRLQHRPRAASLGIDRQCRATIGRACGGPWCASRWLPTDEKKSMSFIKSSLILVGFGVAALAGAIYFGAVHPGADEPHSAVVSKLIESARDRAIAVRARDIIVPTLGDEAQVLNGAGNYAAMCTGCHLAPGMGPTELSKGLYPAPPALSLVGVRDPARAFWVIKHGIKASGMPAWGGSMPDEYIWNMVAFLQKMPELTPTQYEALVASSGGHHHGGGESMPHPDGMPRANSDDPGSAEAGAHDDTGSAPHAHDPAPPQPPAHDDAGSPPHDH